MPIYIGIDPGASGGLAAFDPKCGATITGMPRTEEELWMWISRWNCRSEGVGRGQESDVFVAVELVQGYIGRSGVRGNTMFKFGKNYGAVRMALTAAGLNWETVTPEKWQRDLGVVPRKKHRVGCKVIYDETASEFKGRLKELARELFPNEKVTLKVCDALLIADWLRRKKERGGAGARSSHLQKGRRRAS